MFIQRLSRLIDVFSSDVYNCKTLVLFVHDLWVALKGLFQSLSDACLKSAGTSRSSISVTGTLRQIWSSLA